MIYRLQSNRVWRSYLGGRQIDRLHGKPDPRDDHYPEEWVASLVLAINPGRACAGEGLSQTSDGHVLRDLIAADPIAHVGPVEGASAQARLSILVKLLDAAERLVIQVHPTRAFARQHFNSEYGKTESWYIISTAEDACVYLGFKPGITQAEWKRCFVEQDIPKMLSWLHRLAVRPGDVIFVAGGVPHAIGAGCFMVELQEPTDLVITPERQTPSGLVFPESKLHGGIGFAKMFDCFSYEGLDEDMVRQRYFVQSGINREDLPVRTLIDHRTTDQFVLQELNVDGSLEVEWVDTYAVAVVTSGSGHVRSLQSPRTAEDPLTLSAGDQLFVPVSAGPLCWEGKMRVVISCPGGARYRRMEQTQP